MLTVDIVIKTYPTDYDWLVYAFRSLDRVQGYRDIVVLLEEQYPEPPCLPMRSVVRRTRRYVGTDYASNLGSVVERLRAWSYTDADRILYVDSDCVWSRDIDLQEDPAINAERPVVLWRSWEEAEGAAFLREPAARTLGYDPQRETMCRYPFCFPRETIKACWDFIGGDARLYGLSTKEERDNAGTPPFIRTLAPTDWDVLGNFAIDHSPDAITSTHWRAAGPSCVKQFWSWHRPTHPDVQAELGRLGLL
jgi:hypothetical protein